MNMTQKTDSDSNKSENSPASKDSSPNDSSPKDSSPIVDIVCNIVLPSIVLTKLSSADKLGPINSFYLALSIPFAYGLWSLIKERKFSWMALLGLVNIGLSGGLRFYEVGRVGFAIKEALTPLLLGAAVLFSLKTKTPLVEKLVYSEKIINKVKVDEILEANNSKEKFKSILFRTTLILAFSFLLSAALNFGLALVLLKSPTTSPEFNVELGKMTALSFPVIAVPCMLVVAGALFYLTSGIKKLTGLTTEEILKATPQK